MKLLKEFYTEAEAFTYAEKHRIDNFYIDRNIFSGKYELYDME